ncbi:hypothetical protein KUTeg_018644 [Tegillarca granosa]|uniref:Uncharacterized protein n=1 Tax=Tegillarca granosa TaxID=220873 RepID=A0ABQ9EH43_TEGGR|nr:hypothetical protein KUTeg_018644 [Tegillarca granosa]
MEVQQQSTPLNGINAKGLHSKISRVTQKINKKRGKYREQYLLEIFHIRTCTTQSSTVAKEEQTPDKPQDVEVREKLSKSLEATKIQLERRRSKVKVLQEEKKTIKNDYKCRKVRVRLLEQTKVLNRNAGKLERKNEQLCKKVKEFQHLYIQSIKKLSSVKKELESIHNRDRSLEDKQHEMNLRETITKKTYKPEFVECVKNLTSFKVATQQVGSVVTEVARLCGKNTKSVAI